MEQLPASEGGLAFVWTPQLATIVGLYAAGGDRLHANM